jgi:hypothetical protein
MRLDNHTKLDSKKTRVYAQETPTVRITSPEIYNIEFLLKSYINNKNFCASLNCGLLHTGCATAAGAVAVPG